MTQARSNYGKPLPLSTLAICILSALSQSAIGQNGQQKENDLKIEVIDVTATKKSASYQEVPIALAVMGADKIVEQGIDNLEGVTQFIPNVNISETSGYEALYIRGIGSIGNVGFEQSVGTFVDGVYVGRGRSSRAALMDVKRVEVLKGSQSTLFGKNTIGGALNISTADPTDAFEGSVALTAEPSFGGWGTSVVVSGAITDSLLGRLALKHEETDGYFTNHTLNQDERQEKDTIGRLTLHWYASDTLDFKLKVENGSTDTLGRQNKVGIATPAATQVYRLLGDPNFEDGINFDKYQKGIPGRPEQFDDTEWKNYTLTTNWDLEKVNITSITAYTKTGFDRSLDLDFSPLSLIGEQAAEDHNQFTQEFLLSYELDDDFEFLSGLFYQNENLHSAVNTDVLLSTLLPIFETQLSPDAPELLAVKAGFGDVTAVNRFNQDSETISAFTQMTWHVEDNLRLIVGVRYSNDEKSFNKFGYSTGFNSALDSAWDLPTFSLPNQAVTEVLGLAREHYFDDDGFTLCSSSIVPAPTRSCETIASDNKRRESHWTGDIVLQYDIANDTTTYAKIGNGYKAGGFDAFNRLGIFESEEFEDETVTSYELGLKTALWDGRAHINLALFNNTFEDVQVSVFDGVASFIVDNAAETTTQGVEVDGQVVLSQSLRVSYGLAYLNSEYDEYRGAACTALQAETWTGTGPCLQDLSGEPTMFSPEFSGNIAIDYETEIFNNFDFKASLDLQYMDDYYAVNDNDPITMQNAFTKVNARVALASSDVWSIALLGKNLTDEKIANAPNDIPLGNLGFTGSFFYFLDAPRSYEIQLTYNF